MSLPSPYERGIPLWCRVPVLEWLGEVECPDCFGDKTGRVSPSGNPASLSNCLKDVRKSLILYSPTSGTYEALGPSKNGNHLLERVGNDPLWSVHICQIKHQYSTTSRMSEKSLIIYSLTSGEHICICLKPWIITSRTIIEKTVATLHDICYLRSHALITS